MGWKGTMRSMQAASRKAAREAERRHKAAMKQQALDDAAYAVDAWENYISNLISVHVDLADAIDWERLSTKNKPPAPKRSSKLEKQAQEKLEKFKPRIFDFLSGGSEKKRLRLTEKVREAFNLDEESFKKEELKHTAKLEEWKADVKMANRLMDRDVEAIKEVLQNFQNISKEDRIGTEVRFKIEKDKIHAIPNVHTDEIVPDYRRKLRASGTLSETKMPKGQFNELYQDYVASVALKVAGDLFHVLPYNEVYVTCQASMLNKSTGHKEPTPILSVHFVKETFKTLNLQKIDPSDSLANFNHSMKFRKTTGFQKIDPLTEV